MRYALVNDSTGLVENTVVIGDESGVPVELRSKPPQGYSHIQTDTAGIGDTWNGSAFIPANPPMGAKVLS